MKIIVFSDSHGRCDKMTNIISGFKEKAYAPDYIVHLGDYMRDAKILQKQFPEIPVLYVYGNGEYSLEGNDYEKEVEIGGKKIFILHGHTKNVRFSIDTLKMVAGQKKYDMILYGHTHAPMESYHNGTHIICPGSISRDRSGKGESYCMVDITGKDICANIIYA